MFRIFKRKQVHNDNGNCNERVCKKTKVNENFTLYKRFHAVRCKQNTIISNEVNSESLLERNIGSDGVRSDGKMNLDS